MQFIRLHRPTPRGNRYLAIALITAMIFIVSLHPSTGGWGGAIYILSQWWAPTLVNVLMTAWVISCVEAKKPLRIFLFLTISLLLGLNVSLPRLIVPSFDVKASQTIGHRTVVTAETHVDEGMMTVAPDEITPPLGPSTLGVGVQGNEGCMCLWFDYDKDASYDLRAWHVVNQVIGRWDHWSSSYVDRPASAKDGVHLDIKFFKDAHTSNTVRMTVAIYDGTEKTAVYEQWGLPVATVDPAGVGQDRGLSNPYFMQHSLNILARQNIWGMLLDNVVAAIPGHAFKHFLRQALDVQSVPQRFQ